MHANELCYVLRSVTCTLSPGKEQMPISYFHICPESAIVYNITLRQWIFCILLKKKKKNVTGRYFWNVSLVCYLSSFFFIYISAFLKFTLDYFI